MTDERPEADAPRESVTSVSWTCFGCGHVHEWVQLLDLSQRYQQPLDREALNCDKCGWRPPLDR